MADAFAAGPEAAEAFLHPGTAVAYDARTREDWELNTLFMDHDEYVFHPGDPKQSGPEFAGEYEGVAGYIQAMKHFGESWSDLRVEAGPVKVLDGAQALSMMLWRATGARSGMRMEWTAVGLLEFRDGLVVKQTFWWGMDSAREHFGRDLPADW